MTASPEWLEAHLGPVEAVAIALPESPTASAWRSLLKAVDSHQLRVLDLEFVRRTDTGVEVLPISALPRELPAELHGASSDLLDAADLDAVTADLRAGETAAVLLIEHLSLLQVLHSFESSGGRLLLDGLLDHDDLDAALDGADA